MLHHFPVINMEPKEEGGVIMTPIYLGPDCGDICSGVNRINTVRPNISTVRHMTSDEEMPEENERKRIPGRG